MNVSSVGSNVKITTKLVFSLKVEFCWYNEKFVTCLFPSNPGIHDRDMLREVKLVTVTFLGLSGRSECLK